MVRASQTIERLNGSEKAAVLLLNLGEDMAGKVLGEMGQDEIQHLGNYMASIGTLSQDLARAVNEEFLRKTISGANKGLGVGNVASVRKLLESALGEDAAENLISNLSVPTEEAGIETLRLLDAKTIANFLKNEHPQTIALILAHLDAEKSAEVLSLMNEGIRGEVAYRMATLDRIPPSVINDLDTILGDELAASGSGQTQLVGGIHSVAEILNYVDKSNENLIVSKIDELNPELAEEIRNMMFTFDDLIFIDDRGIQQVLREVSNEDLTIALRGSGDEVKEKILENLSERAADMIREDLEAMGPVRLSDVEKAQQGITNTAKRLEDEGKIIIARGGGGGEVLV
ncbi:MAG: flagellar motor switch protein FliG [Nitrospinaceae bacterium]|jgi:flagellar motor switch protein FliG|nr:flagellar motor switch protein FliG [Nitrospinaceae bacterium]MBT3434028.1 flagellar motor switch protein FliG [Nitrospinaceae bacterium]MBT3820755.1 flagellar motor switch protein FliG [Nitrospinaceae bacterium]MBT4429600.1 flagellar motor switch protein FliG [Nitrospinaceae bacterium]MBT5367088.1 flagellar motor switch protein FliG [Nitrospinaceae bacterium]